MQFSTIVTLLSAAMVASANPTVRRTGGGGGGSTSAPCSTSGEKPVCCDGLLGALTCTVSILGGNCNSNSYCCKTDAAAGVLINISALNCVQL